MDEKHNDRQLHNDDDKSFTRPSIGVWIFFIIACLFVVWLFWSSYKDKQDIKSHEVEITNSTSNNEVILYSNDDFIISYTGAKFDNRLNCIIVDFICENKLNNKLHVMIDNVSIDGFIISDAFSFTVEPLDENSNYLDFYYSDLEELGMEDVYDSNELTFSIRVWQNDMPNADYLVNETMVVSLQEVEGIDL